MTNIRIKRGDQDTDAQRKDHVKKKGDIGHLQAMEDASKEMNSANILTSDFWLP